MGACTSIARKWGNSLGVTIPGDVVKEIHIQEGDEVDFLIVRKKNPLRKWAGTIKTKTSTDQLMRDIDQALYSREDA